MWMVAWTLNHGSNNMEDFFLIKGSRREAMAYVNAELMPLDNLHCWGVATITDASEPHWSNP